MTIVKEPMSDILIDAIETARKHDCVLVRRGVFRGSWTWRGCPQDKSSGCPVWDVTDNTVQSLIRRGFAVVTHTRAGDRPAVIRVKSEDEMPPAPPAVRLDDLEPTLDEVRGMRWWNRQTDIGRSYYLSRCDSPKDAWARYKQAVADRQRRTA